MEPTIGERVSEAEKRLVEFTDQVNALPEWERKEVAECVNILRRMVLRYDASAKLAMVGMLHEIACTTPAPKVPE